MSNRVRAVNDERRLMTHLLQLGSITLGTSLEPLYLSLSPGQERLSLVLCLIQKRSVGLGFSGSGSVVTLALNVTGGTLDLSSDRVSEVLGISVKLLSLGLDLGGKRLALDLGFVTEFVCSCSGVGGDFTGLLTDLGGSAKSEDRERLSKKM
jgi:hypothetical protein